MSGGSDSLAEISAGRRAEIPAHLRQTGVDAEWFAELAAANRILYSRGVVDGFGHISARHPKRPDRFFIARNMAPGQVTPADLTELDMNGEPVGEQPGRPYLERYIHSAILRLRPDVMSVVHSHSPSVVPFSVVPQVSLRPVCHMCGFLKGPAKVFEIRDAAGASSDLLIRDQPLGNALAESLGQEPVVLMRGHGSTVVGESIREAVFRAVYTEVNARLQMDALKLGEPIYLTPGEAAATTNAIGAQIDRAWNLWLAEIDLSV